MQGRPNTRVTPLNSTMPTYHIRVPATTANLGPGFDCLGMALELYNRFRFSLSDRPHVTVSGQGADRLRGNKRNLVYRAAERYFEALGKKAPPMTVDCHNEVPLARGLGSSSAAIVGGLLGASAVSGEETPNYESIWKLAVEMEGHPDNVTPALFGGCQVVVQDEGELVRSWVPLPEGLRAVLYIPDSPMPTARARDILVPQISREDAVYNIGRVAMLVNSLATGDVEKLGVATRDRLHQPQRGELLPAMRLLFQAASAGGALGVFLSGAGSTILALTRGRELTVAYEMRDMGAKALLPGEVKITRPSDEGALITRH